MTRRWMRGKVPSGTHVLDLGCAGPMSSPKQACTLHITVPMPFDLDFLQRHVAIARWIVTMTSPPGERPLSFTVLCPSCAEAVLPPELLRAARRAIPGSA